jgi:hypothetical protein
MKGIQEHQSYDNRRTCKINKYKKKLKITPFCTETNSIQPPLNKDCQPLHDFKCT